MRTKPSRTKPLPRSQMVLKDFTLDEDNRISIRKKSVTRRDSYRRVVSLAMVNEGKLEGGRAVCQVCKGEHHRLTGC